jgi:Xaa-Pro dipeptidase
MLLDDSTRIASHRRPAAQFGRIIAIGIRMDATPAALYADHVTTLLGRASEALRRCGREHLLIASGVEKYHFLDDRPYPFQPNPHFKAWLPLTRHPHCWLVITPGTRPRLVYFQPDDYWHLPPSAPEGYWTGQFEIVVIGDADHARRHLPPAAASAIVGEADAALGDWQPDNPPALLDYLHWHRGIKTPYELALMRLAQARAVLGHRAAEAAFRAGGSELAIHRAYLEATGHNDLDLPYGNIVGLNEHAAVLHYQYQQPERPAQSRSLLIDAGASAGGYASDITRSYGNGDPHYQALIEGVDRVQQGLTDRVRDGVDYRDLQLEAHRALAGLLVELGVLRGDPDAAVEHGISAVFFPHGLGHLIGLQVHDVGGFQRDADGGNVAAPDGHRHLRLTRRLAPGMVVTIEPGIYFIDSLLAGLRNGPHADAVDWRAVEHLRAFGGVRIEDEVACTAGAPENLTRNAFAAAGG